MKLKIRDEIDLKVLERHGFYTKMFAEEYVKKIDDNQYIIIDPDRTIYIFANVGFDGREVFIKNIGVIYDLILDGLVEKGD